MTTLGQLALQHAGPDGRVRSLRGDAGLASGRMVRRTDQPQAPPVSPPHRTELEAGIRKWINEWNKNPGPFDRTKSADDILKTLAAYCHRISSPES
jgi:hypothetical protein